MMQISIDNDLYQQLQTYAKQHQRQVDDVVHDWLAEAIRQQATTIPSADKPMPSVEEVLAELDEISGSLSFDDTEERIRNHDRYFAGLEDEDAP
jgi:hypothetical protein